MKSKLRSSILLAVGAILTPIATVVTAGSAQAAGHCTDSQHKSISTPGFNTDLYVKVCATEGTSRHHGAYMIVSWHDGGSSASDGDRKFDSLRVHARVERNNTVYATDSWSIAGRVNRNESDTWSSTIVYAASSTRGAWSGDGYISYDVDRDGEGTQPVWSLHGSPLVY